MNSLKEYIKESLIDNNIFYKLNVWFMNNESQMDNFLNIIGQCKQDKTITVDNLTKYISSTFLEEHLKEFVNFIIDDVHDKIKDKDYLTQLKTIIEFLLTNNSLQNKWKNKAEG